MWITKFLTSSIGQKVIMSLTGLFLIIFLLVHLVGNLQLFLDDRGEAFNVYAHFMTTNPIIQATSIGLYATFLLHAIQGIVLAWNNRKARGAQKYAVKQTRGSWSFPWISSNMALLGSILFVFLCIHMGDFWWSTKRGLLENVAYGDDAVMTGDLYRKVYASFKIWWVVLIYEIGMVALALHLLHGFASAFQTLGLNHPKWMPLIKAVGIVYSILIPLGFAIIPLYIFFGVDIPEYAYLFE